MKKNKFLDNLALAISFLGSPFIVIALMFAVIAWNYKESLPQFYSYLVVTGTFIFIIPVAFMLENVKDLRFIDLHFTNKAEREKVLAVTSISVLSGYFMLSFIGVPKPLLLIELVGIINLLIMAFLTFKLKLSLHLATVTVAATLVVFFLGDSFAWLYLLLIPLAWARKYREKHSLVEIVTGVFVSFLVTITIIEIFRTLG